MKAVYVDYIFKDKSIEERIYGEHGIEFVDASKLSREEMYEACKDADAVVSTYVMIDKEFISHLEKCKILVRTGIGFNTIDIEEASRKGIMVANVRDYCIEEVGDHAVMLTLALLRKLVRMNEKVKKEHRWTVADMRPVPRISTLTIALYGLGAIGKDYAKKMKALGCRVIAYDPFVDAETFAAMGIEKYENRLDIFKEADVLSVHVPLNNETHHSVGEPELALMKPSAYVINVSRGEIIDEKALTKALREGRIAGAGLDVLESENPDLTDEIVQMEQTIITPHIAYYSTGSELSLQELSAVQAVQGLIDGKPTFFLNRKAFEK